MLVEFGISIRCCITPINRIHSHHHPLLPSDELSLGLASSSHVSRCHVRQLHRLRTAFLLCIRPSPRPASLVAYRRSRHVLTGSCRTFRNRLLQHSTRLWKTISCATDTHGCIAQLSTPAARNLFPLRRIFSHMCSCYTQTVLVSSHCTASTARSVPRRAGKDDYATGDAEGSQAQCQLA